MRLGATRTERRSAVGLGPAAELVLCTAAFGSVFVAARSVAQEAHPLMVSALRFIIAGSALLVILRLKSGRAGLSFPKFLMAFPAGFVGVFAYNALFFYGMRYAPAVDAAMIIPTVNPIATVWLSALLLGEPVTRRRVWGLALAVLGMVLVFAGALTEAEAGSQRPLGDFLLLGAALCWSGYALTGRLALKKMNALELTAYSCTWGAVLLSFTALPVSPGFNQTPHPDSFWMAVAYMSLVGTVLAFFLWHRGVESMGTARASAFLYLIPMFALIFAALFLQEYPTPVQVAGMLVVLGGVYLSGRNEPASVALGEPPLVEDEAAINK